MGTIPYPSCCIRKHWIFRKNRPFWPKSPTNGAKWGSCDFFQFTQFWHWSIERAEFQLSRRIMKFWFTQTSFKLRYFQFWLLMIWMILEHSTITGHIHLKRRLSFYLLQVYFPSWMIVACSWVSFWIHKTDAPARVCIGKYSI